MAGIKISALPPVSAALLTDFFPVVQAGITSQETLQQVATLLGANIQLAAYTQVTGLGTASTKTASNNPDSTVASITGSVTTGHIAVFADGNGSLQDGGATPGGYLPLSGGTMTGSIVFDTTKGIQTNTTATNTLLLQAYNTNTAAYVSMATLTAGNPPTMDLNTGVTIGVAYIYRAGGSVVALADGGTNAAITASNGGIVWSNATQLQVLAGTATAGLPFLSGSTATPAWGAFALSLGGALTTSGAVTYSGAYAITWTLTAGTTLTLPTSGTLATTSQLPSGAALTRTSDTNVTLTLGGTPATALLEATSLTLGWTGTLAVTRGGTGSGSVVVVPAATAWAGWDANSNMSANNFIAGYSTTVTAGTSTTLTVASAYQQYFTGTSSQTVVMPVANTLVKGMGWNIVNDSTGTLTVNSSGGSLIISIPASQESVVTCILNSGTTAASWSTQEIASGGGTVTSVATAGLASGGPITSSGTVTVTAATHAQQVTGTSTTTVVTPAVQQYHPSACAFWVSFTGSTGVILNSFGVTSVTRISTGLYVITVSNAFANANWCPMALGLIVGNWNVSVPTAITTTTLTIQFLNLSMAQDPTTAFVCGFGTQT